MSALVKTLGLSHSGEALTSRLSFLVRSANQLPVMSINGGKLQLHGAPFPAPFSDIRPCENSVPPGDRRIIFQESP